MDFEKTSRRSFIKKTTALAVGIASATFFSGIANAMDYSEKCERASDPLFDPGIGGGGFCFTIYSCTDRYGITSTKYLGSKCPAIDGNSTNEDWNTYLACQALPLRSRPTSGCGD